MYPSQVCPNCSEPVNPLAHRCRSCGFAVSAGTPSAGTQVPIGAAAPRPSWPRVVFFAVIGALVLTAIGVGAAQSGDGDAPASATAKVAAAGDSSADAGGAMPVEPDPSVWGATDSAERSPDFTFEIMLAACNRITYCGGSDAAARSLCQTTRAASRLRDYGSYDRYTYNGSYDPYPPRQPACDYDVGEVTACLRAVDRLSCAGAPRDLLSWLRTATSLPECEAAYRCRSR